MANGPPSDSVGPCNGAPDCPAVLHIHGCFRDDPCPHDRSPERAIEPPSDCVTIAVEGRDPEPWPDVIPRLLALIDALSAIPGVRARIDMTVTVTSTPHA